MGEKSLFYDMEFNTILCIDDLMPEFISCARIESNHKKIYRDLLGVIMDN